MLGTNNKINIILGDESTELDTRGKQCSTQEDELLRQVVEVQGVEDWTKNAEHLRLKSQSALQKQRTGKQCRQRWYNHLDPFVVKSRWTDQEETLLFEKHKLYGNKWKQLTKFLPGRTDNDIKNHFYSILRRSLRRLNKYIGEKNSTNQMRELKPSILTEIISYIYKENQQDEDIQKIQDELFMDSLKEIPQLIFKFSSFKPIKTNMSQKVDQNIKNQISHIFTLIQQFKKMSKPQKHKSQTSPLQPSSPIPSKQKRVSFESPIFHPIVTIQNLPENPPYPNSLQQPSEPNPHRTNAKTQNPQICTQTKKIVTKAVFSVSNHKVNGKVKVNGNGNGNGNGNQGGDKEARGGGELWTPKSVRSFREGKEGRSMTSVKEDNRENKSGVFSFMFLQQRTENQLISIDDPSLDLQHDNSLGCINWPSINDLIVIGKQIQPTEHDNCHDRDKEGEGGFEEQGGIGPIDDIDEILYENYEHNQ